MKNIILYIVLGISLVSCTYLFYENNYIKKHTKYIEMEKEQLKESPGIYLQNAIEQFDNKNYTGSKENLSRLIAKFPTSSLTKLSQEKIKEINLIEIKKKEEEQRIIKSLPKQITNAKNAINAEKILDNLDSKYDNSYSELKQVIKNERNKIRIKIEQEKQKKLENRLGGGYKNLKWGMSTKQVFQILSYKYYYTITNGEIYQFDLKEGNTIYCRFYHNKLYEVLSGVMTTNSGENNQQNVYKKLLQKFSNEFGEQYKYDPKQECHIWEDKYTTITLYTNNTRYTALDVAVCYQSKNIINQMEKDRVSEQEESQNKYNKYIDNQINNL